MSDGTDKLPMGRRPTTHRAKRGQTKAPGAAKLCAMAAERPAPTVHPAGWPGRTPVRELARPFRWHDLPRLAKEAVDAWIDDRAASMGAALAYYTLFSIAPLLLIVIAVAGAVFGEDAARGAIFAPLAELLGREGAIAIEGLLDSVRRHDQGLLGSVVGGLLLLVGATSVFAELQGSLDRIWRVPQPAQQPGWLALLRTRLLSFGLVLGVGFLLMVSLVMSAVLSAWGRWWAPAFGGWSTVLQLANFAVGYAITTAMFAMIYKWMPSVRIAWRDVLVGAVCTALLFSIGKWAIGLYIGTSGVASGFGAASSIVVLLVWVYWSAQIFLVGAEFTWLFAQRHGSRAGAPR